MFSLQSPKRPELPVIRVAIAERTQMSTNLLAKVLARSTRFHIVAAVLPAELLEVVRQAQPEVAIISADTDAGPTKGVEVVRQLRALVPEVRVIVLADSSDRELVVHTFQAGARGLFLRAETVERLPKCIQRTFEGEIWATKEQFCILVDTLMTVSPFKVFDSHGTELLSGRELEVVELAARGLTNREIAKKLALSEHTIKNYIFGAFNKLGVCNRVELLFYLFNQFGIPSQQSVETVANNGHAAMGNLRNAAERGSVSSQFALGKKYLLSNHSEKNRGLAFFWLRLAEEGGKETSEASRAALDNLRSSMTAAEMEREEQQVATWLKSHHPNIAER